MARTLQNVELFINTDKDGTPQDTFFTYKVVDGTAISRQKTHRVSNPDWNKTLHNTGAVGEFWKDEVDIIKIDEGVR